MIIVIGGGISGLATAHALTRAGQEVTVLESGPRSGGKIRSVREAGCLFEHGPDGFLAQKPAALQLVRELGLEGALVAPRALKQQTWLLDERKGLLPFPAGLALGIPTRWWPVLRSSLLSWKGKLRLACEPLIRRGPAADESLASFVERRLGREALTRLVGPLAGGVYAADPRELSLQAAFPQLAALERTHGSLTRGLLRPAPGPRPAMLSFTEGMEQLVEALRLRLPGRVATDRPVRAAAPGQVELADGETRRADAVVVAVPSPAGLLRARDEQLAGQLAQIPLTSSSLVHLVFDASQVRKPLDGHGWVSGHPDLHTVRACSITSRKYPGRAPAGTIQLRAFLPGRGGEPSELIGLALRELAPLLGLEGPPRHARTWVHQQTMPWYRVGHRQLVEGIDERLQRDHPGLFLTGSAVGGIGVADRIDQGERTAERVLRYLAGGQAERRR